MKSKRETEWNVADRDYEKTNLAQLRGTALVHADRYERFPTSMFAPGLHEHK